MTTNNTDQVKLVWITNDAEKVISYCARVSNPANQENYDTAAKLLRYCYKNNHWSVFEMASMCLEINTTRAIAAQILRHRSFSFQEFCLASNSMISCVAPYNYSIGQLYQLQQQGSPLPYVIVFDEEHNKFVGVPILQVFDTGKKSCVKISLENGRTLTSTLEHKFLNSQNQFLPLSDFKVGDEIATYVSIYEPILYQTIVSIIPETELVSTFDMEVLHNSHNYVANSIVSHNSQRYANVNELDIELPKFRIQDIKNRQSSHDTLDIEKQTEFQEKTQQLFEQSKQLYNEMIEHGVAKESARFILPLSTQTRIYMNGTIRSWIHYCNLRCEEGTQLEHREIAKQIRDILIKHIPSLNELIK